MLEFQAISCYILLALQKQVTSARFDVHNVEVMFFRELKDGERATHARVRAGREGHNLQGDVGIFADVKQVLELCVHDANTAYLPV
ncbi:hypothetical protein SAMN05421869_14441 [Nonomuraea jiangxiensis]|uniref:Uncharacterized protein n=1 Tax=Nonomuraea jiangxiensis TaxID=633440 RepID=A0A1G9TD03_9ACTN|nr:hypothetical protein SAMN05421869_14441 [Nonomuraea jiangxiensis]